MHRAARARRVAVRLPFRPLRGEVHFAYSPRLEAPVTYEQIVSVLGYAEGHELPVRIVTSNQMEVIGVPISLDTDIAAHEVYLRPEGDLDTEIALSLGSIEVVELV